MKPGETRDPLASIERRVTQLVWMAGVSLGLTMILLLLTTILSWSLPR